VIVEDSHRLKGGGDACAQQYLTTSQRAEQINFRLWAASVGGLFHFKPNEGHGCLLCTPSDRLWCRWVGRGILASRSSAWLKQCRTVAAQSSFSSMPARAGREANGLTIIMTCGTAKPKLSGAFIEPPLHRRDGPGSGRSPNELYSGQPTSDMQHRARKRWQRSSRRGGANRL
jgi:hypothetical protein